LEFKIKCPRKKDTKVFLLPADNSTVERQWQLAANQSQREAGGGPSELHPWHGCRAEISPQGVLKERV
jgi:hypothetical protein